MERVHELLSILELAVREGRNVKVTADEFAITTDQTTATALEITID